MTMTIPIKGGTLTLDEGALAALLQSAVFTPAPDYPAPPRAPDPTPDTSGVGGTLDR